MAERRGMMRGWLGWSIGLWWLAGCAPANDADFVPVASEGARGGSKGAEPARDAGDAPLDGMTMESGPPAVPDSPHCANVADWNPRWQALEAEVLELTNEARAKEQNCGSKGTFAPTGPLVMEPHLRCAARLHSQYMAANLGTFGHHGVNGSLPKDRVTAAGYAYVTVGENVGVGKTTAREIVDAWLASDGHCRMLMHPDFTELGIGYAFGRWDTEQPVGVVDAPYWTQDFGRPRGLDAPDSGPAPNDAGAQSDAGAQEEVNGSEPDSD